MRGGREKKKEYHSFCGWQNGCLTNASILTRLRTKKAWATVASWRQSSIPTSSMLNRTTRLICTYLTDDLSQCNQCTHLQSAPLTQSVGKGPQTLCKGAITAGKKAIRAITAIQTDFHKGIIDSYLFVIRQALANICGLPSIWALTPPSVGASSP